MWVLEAKSSDNMLKLLKQCWWRHGKIVSRSKGGFGMFGKVWHWTCLVLLCVWPDVGKKMWQKYKYCLGSTENETKGLLEGAWGRWIDVEGSPWGWYESENSLKLWSLIHCLLSVAAVVSSSLCERAVGFYPGVDGTWGINHGRDNRRKLLGPAKSSVGVSERRVIK